MEMRIEGWFIGFWAGGLLVLAILGGLDLAMDAGQSNGGQNDRAGHVVLKFLFVLVSLTTSGVLGWKVLLSIKEFAALNRTVRRQSDEKDRWKAQAQEYLQGLGVAIAQQYALWKLTEAEREKALFFRN